VDRDWLRKFLRHRIADERLLRLVGKWLAAGVVEEGVWSEGQGTPQGASISPLLANVYLHHVLDLWVDWWRRHHARGEVIIVRFADDFICGFQHRADAQRFLVYLRQRMAKFGLELHPDKTRLIEFGRFAADNRVSRGLGKPETFDFLGFTHICGTSRNGRFKLKRVTIAKRMRMALVRIKDELKRRMHQPIPQLGRWLASVVRGHMAYYAVPDNGQAVGAFLKQVTRLWLKTLRRRSQRTMITWARMSRLEIRWLPKVRIMHPYPNVRLDAKTQGRSPVR
jgi:RNA-directed DNA polymerase